MKCLKSSKLILNVDVFPFKKGRQNYGVLKPHPVKFEIFHTLAVSKQT